MFTGICTYSGPGVSIPPNGQESFPPQTKRWSPMGFRGRELGGDLGAEAEQYALF